MRRVAVDSRRIGATMTAMTLTLLSYGSPDPRHGRDVAGLAARLRLTGLPSQVSYLDHTSPSPTQAARLLQETGVEQTTVVPLMLSPAFHVRVDVPAAVAAMRAAAPGLAVAASEPVAVHPLILTAVIELVVESGLPVGPRTGLILAATGSRDPHAVAAMDSLVRAHGSTLVNTLGVRSVRAAYLDGGRPLGRTGALMRALDGATSFLVVPMMVADGPRRDRIVSAARRADLPVVPGTLSWTTAMADLVVLRAGSAPRPGFAPTASPDVLVSGRRFG